MGDSLGEQLRRRLETAHIVDEIPLSRDSAAVAVVFRQGVEGLELLLVKRVAKRSDPWSGQVSFPGGRWTASDRNMLETALRELEEEAGISADQVEVLTAMPSVRPRNMPSLQVRPYVCVTWHGVEPNPGPEVSKAYWVGVKHLRRRLVKVYSPTAKYYATTLCYHFDGEVVWGMTANILRRLSTLLGF